MKENIEKLKSLYFIGAIVIICILIFVTLVSTDLISNSKTGVIKKEFDYVLNIPTDSVLIRTQRGPRYMNRHKLRVFLEKIKIKLGKIHPQQAMQDISILTPMPLFNQKNTPPPKKIQQQQFLIKQAIANLQEFASINNIDLRRDFCEVRYNGGPTDAIEKHNIMRNIEQNTALQNQVLEVSDEPQLMLLVEKLEVELEHILFMLSKNTALATKNTILDIRMLELLIPDFNDIEQLVSLPKNTENAKLAELGDIKEQFINSPRKLKHVDMNTITSLVNDDNKFIEHTLKPATTTAAAAIINKNGFSASTSFRISRNIEQSHDLDPYYNNTLEE